jgi:uncharacterized protein
MDEIELKVHDMSSTLQPADAYALVLEEVNGNRKLPIIIGSLEAQAIKVVMMGYKMPRPLTHDLFLTVTKELGTALKKVLIYKVKDGVYYSYLFLEKEGEVFKIDSRTSDAIALAMRCGCPVYTTDEIMESEQLHEVGSTAFSPPLPFMPLFSAIVLKSNDITIAASLGIALAYSLSDEQEAISSTIATSANPQIPFLIFLFLV